MPLRRPDTGIFSVALAGCLALGMLCPMAAMADGARTVPQTRDEITLSFAPVVRQAAPAVVNIFTKKLVERRASPFAGDPFFERFFRDMFPRPRGGRRMENSLGSGVILDPKGIVVSNHHVVAGADEITVVLQDRREFRGKVIFADKESDLAVVQLEDAADLPTLELRDSDTLEVGDLVLAIGNPFGVGQTVTSGIVSGLARTGRGRRSAGFFIQTDAAINPGNSGGALVDMQGRLVGVNTAILSRSGGSNGIGFAVPANLVAKVVHAARSGHAELIRPWLGLDAQAVDAELASAIGFDRPRGVLIEALHPRSPLSAAGLRRGDVVLEIGGQPVNTEQELDFRLATKAIGSGVAIGYSSKGTVSTVEIVLAEPPDEPARDRRTLQGSDGLPGLTVSNINPAVIEEHDLPIASEGVLVVRAQGPARRIGLRRGDFIRQVNGSDVTDVAALIDLVKTVRTPQVILDVERGGRRGKIRFQR